jgi:predicted amidohydrolase YtcJ
MGRQYSHARMPANGVPVDLVLVGGRVVTMDDARHTAEAVAVQAGRIVAVGSSAGVQGLAGPRTRRIDLRGRTLLPGFQDAHVHVAIAAVGFMRCRLHDLPQEAGSYLAAIAAYADAHPDAAWVLGDGWYLAAFPGGTPTAVALDGVVRHRPAFFVNRDIHAAWANTRALELAGITADTPDPPHGRIERGPDGAPTGTLHESAVDLVRGLTPAPSIEERVDGLRVAQAYLHRYGITAWQDAWVTPDDLEAYRLLAGRGQLTGRAVAALWWERERGGEQMEDLVERRRTGSIGRLTAGTVKIMQDGVAENQSAAMLRPYVGADGRPTTNTGQSFVDPEQLKDHVRRLDALGFQVHFHAIGDRGVREALDAIEAARQANGWTDHRPHLAHVQVVDPVDRARFRALGAAATIQPYWACHDPQMDELTWPYLPADRAALQYPFRSLRAAGATLAGGSDWTVSTPNVLAEVEVAVTRVSPEHRDRPPFLPDEGLSLMDALAAFTRGSAYVNHLDDRTGTVEVGKLADLVVLDRDLFGQGSGVPSDARVLLTLSEGDVVFKDPGLDGP